MPELVRSQAESIEARVLARVVELAHAPVVDAQRRTALGGEDVGVGVAVLDKRSEFRDERRGDGHGPAFAGLGHVFGRFALDLGEGDGDADAPLGQVDPMDAQGRRFTPAESGVGEQQHERAVHRRRCRLLAVLGAQLRRRVGERFHLVIGEVNVFGFAGLGELEALRRVERDPARDAPAEDHGQHRVRVLGLGGTEVAPALVARLLKLGDPDGDVLAVDRVEREFSPAVEDVVVQETPVLPPGGALDVGTCP
nr:hypothetical protein [Streptomonospora litoralis]